MKKYFLSRRSWFGGVLGGVCGWFAARGSFGAALSTTNNPVGGCDRRITKDYPTVTTLPQDGQGVSFTWDREPSNSDFRVVVVWDDFEPKCRVYLEPRDASQI